MHIIQKIKKGFFLGIIAGIIDVIPMMIQKLSWDANLSALTMWIIAGLVIATTDIKVKGNIKNILKGIIISFLLLSPYAILIAFINPAALIPISIMTLILGSFLGFFTYRIKND